MTKTGTFLNLPIFEAFGQFCSKFFVTYKKYKCQFQLKDPALINDKQTKIFAEDGVVWVNY